MELDVIQKSSYMPKESLSTANKTPKISENRINSATTGYQEAALTNLSSSSNDGSRVQKALSPYEMSQVKTALESNLDELVKQIMPNLGVKFRVHDSGQIITSVVNNDSQEVVREFPAEKILDMIYDMCTKIGLIVNKKV